jgi:hypothetical protein
MNEADSSVTEASLTVAEGRSRAIESTPEDLNWRAVLHIQHFHSPHWAGHTMYHSPLKH